MRTRAGVIAAVVVAFALTGCSDDGGDEPEAVETTPPASSAPLTAESLAAAPSGEAAYLEAVREALPANTVIPNATDEQLLAAGSEACDEISGGADTLTLSLIPGEPADASGFYPDSAAIISSARASLCEG